jgi:hypothetical protein
MQFIRKPHFHFWVGTCVAALSVLACRPVLAISWNEFLIIGVLFAVLLGPPVYRLFRRAEEFFKHKGKQK